MIRAILVILLLTSGSAAFRHALNNDAMSEAVASRQIVQNARPEPEEEESTISVIVATRDIETGYQLTVSDIGWVSMPANEVSSDFIRDVDGALALDHLIGLSAGRDFLEGDPIILDSLHDVTQRSLSGSVRPGMRAFSVLIELDAMAGGLILPGDRVDVVYTFYPSESESAVSMIIASDVRLLALDEMTVAGYRVVTTALDLPSERNATLELTPDQIGLVSAAEEEGRLRLALRSADEVSGPTQIQNPVIRVNRGGTISLEVR